MLVLLFLPLIYCFTIDFAANSNAFITFNNEKVPIIDCGSPESTFKLQSVDMTPFPPQKGQKFTVDMKGELRKTFSRAASVTVLVKKGRFVVKKIRKQVCDLLESSPTLPKCPLKPGVYTIKESGDFPRAVPRGKYTIDIFGADGDTEMFCFQMALKL